MKQIGLDLFGGTGAAKPTEAPKPASPEEHLHALVEGKECMVFLYGMNRHLCFIRTHSSDDRTGKIWPINRGTAEEILKKGRYSLRSNHTAANGKQAKVYSPK